jgi:hypothetical protein
MIVAQYMAHLVHDRGEQIGPLSGWRCERRLQRAIAESKGLAK